MIERSGDRVLFFPDGKYRFGNLKAYVLNSNEELNSVYSFFQKYLIYSSLWIAIVIIVFFVTIPFITHIGSLILCSAIISSFTMCYHYKIKKCFKDMEIISCTRTMDFFWFFKINWRIWLFTVILLVVSIVIAVLIGRIIISI